MIESTLSIYSHNGNVAIETPGGVCYISPQVAIEVTVSLTRAALKADPKLDVAAITEAFVPHHESVQ